MFLGFHFFPKILAALGIALLVATVRVSACEGDCIAGVTHALVGNYSVPVNLAISQIEKDISSELALNNNVPAGSCLRPIVEEYNRRAYDHMENAVFKNYFHGKCQNAVTGIEPAGCPNPDCPVVCGTPGSIVHFYPKFRDIAFSATVSLIRDISRPGSPAYKNVKKLVSATPTNAPGRRLLRYQCPEQQITPAERPTILAKKRSNGPNVDVTLNASLSKIDFLLESVCGSSGLCNWEEQMKAFILTFP